MKMSLRKSDPLLKMLNNSLLDMPAPVNISSWWNFGSLLGLCLMSQIMTGLLLALHYHNSLEGAFDSVVHICRDVNHGWLLRTIHANMASAFFICIYIHTGRGIYYKSYLYKNTWMSGVTILFLLMATAFLGYVLPWGQMSFWGATVITNLLSTVPYVGTSMVYWLWGGFAVDGATLTRFFSFHFILPFIMAALVMIHILLLHQTGSNNPLGINSAPNKIPFHPYFTLKDAVGFLVLLVCLLMLVFIAPYLCGDPENFTPANPLMTPPHIQPEWYYLFAYAILRAIPNKLGGVIALVLSIAILYVLPFTNSPAVRSSSFYFVNNIMFWSFVTTVLLLTWVGACAVESPYILVSQFLTLLYFMYFLMNPIITAWWDAQLF